MNNMARIKAALLWDLPALYRDGTQESREFVDALELRGPSDRSTAQALTPPLAVAARGIRRELEGDSGEATLLYSELAASDSWWTATLGQFLLCWSSSEGSAARYEQLAGRLAAVDDPLLRARLLWKLMTWAVDRGYRDELERLALQTIELVPVGTELYNVGSTELRNLGMGHLVQRDRAPEPESAHDIDEPLTDYPWLISDAYSQARASAIDELLRRARQGRVTTMTIGTGRTNRLLALQLQAEWAGAAWLLRGIRQQLAAQTLSSLTRPDNQSGFACVMWIAGGGSDTRAVLDYAEPSFESATVEYIVKEVSQAYRPPFFGDRQLSETVLSLWDEIGGPQAKQLLARLEVPAGDHPNSALGRRAFMCLGVQAPEAWLMRFLAFSEELQQAVAEEVAWLDVDLLPEAMLLALSRKGRVTKMARESSDLGKIAAVAIASRTDAQLARELVRHLPATGIARVAAIRPDLLTQSDAEQAALDIHSLLSKQLADARKGRYGMGGEDLYGDYAQLIAMLASSDNSWVNLVEGLALTPGLPLEYRSGALRIAAQLAVGGRVTPALARSLERTSADGQSLWNVVSPDLINAQKLLLRATVDRAVSPALEAGLFVASRHPDPSVRIVPLVAIHNLGSSGGAALVDAVLFGALYDENQSVIQNALAVLTGVDIQYSPSRPLVRDRLRYLYATGSRNTRIGVVRAARHAAIMDKSFEDLISRAREDRSLLVRRATGSSPVKNPKGSC